MTCPICEKGVLRKQKVDVEKYGEAIGMFTADVCSNCGEQIFDSHEARKIEGKTKELGLWGVPSQTRIYKVGGNFVISLKKKIAESLGITKPMDVRLIPQVKQKRIVVEVS